MQMNIAEAKAKLSELIAAAERGEDAVIARGGKPVGRLVSAQEKEPAFRFGIAACGVSGLDRAHLERGAPEKIVTERLNPEGLCRQEQTRPAEMLCTTKCKGLEPRVPHRLRSRLK